MKRITELDTKVPHPDLSPDPKVAAQQQADCASLRRLLRLIAIGYVTRNIEEADIFAQIALKLRQVEDAVNLEDREFDLLMEKVGQNVLEWQGFMHKWVVENMREAQKRKVEVKVEELK